MAITRSAGNVWISTRTLSGGGPTYVERTAVSAVAAGDLLVAAVQIMGNKTCTFSDTVNGAWAGGDVYIPAASGALGARWAIGWFPNSAAGSPTVRATLPDDTVNRTIAWSSYSGVATTSPKDGTEVYADGSSDSAMNPGTITSTGDALFIGLAAWSSPAGNPTPAASFTDTQITSGDYAWAMEDRIVTGANTIAPSWSNKTFWRAIGIAFKSAGGGGGGGNSDGPILYVRRQFFNNDVVVQY